MSVRLRLGVLECLLGRPVRYDGGHQHDRYLTGVLGRWVEWVAVCPEVEIGLGTPRPPVDLVTSGTQCRLVVRSVGEDFTDRMEAWAHRRLSGLWDLDGFVFKQDSPSCGMRRVRVFAEQGGRERRCGVGIFARALMERFPPFPVVEEECLTDPVLRGNLVDRLFAMRRWRDFLAGDPAVADLVAFHSRAKMTLLSHHQRKYRELGRLVADAGSQDPGPLLEEYGSRYAEILGHPANRRRHLNVLQHLAGHLKRELDEGTRAELTGVIGAYGEGRVPLVVPIELLRRHVCQIDSEWAGSQTYLNPYPDDLME